MRRSLLAALLATMLLTWPAEAQLFPAGPSGSAPVTSTERVLLDATVWVNPSLDQNEGLCLALDAGTVTISAKRIGETPRIRPAELHFYGFRADPDAGLKLPITGQEQTATTRVLGVDHYCWQINVNAPETKNMSNVEVADYIQTVAIKITLVPQ